MCNFHVLDVRRAYLQERMKTYVLAMSCATSVELRRFEAGELEDFGMNIRFWA